MRIVLALILALASAAAPSPLPPQPLRVVSYYSPEVNIFKIKYVPMTDAEYREFYHAEIVKILDSLRKRK